MAPASKPLVWLAGEIKTPPFGVMARREAGFLLRMIQDGESVGMPREDDPGDSEVGRRYVQAETRAVSQGSRLMKKTTKAKLKAAGWKVGTVAGFLDLSKEDEAFVELKVALAKALRRRREAKGLTQSQVAALVGSSQPRVAFMEASEASVSLDLLVRTLLATGASLQELAGVIRSAGRPSAA